MSARKLPRPSKRPLRAPRVAAFNPALPEDDSLIVASVLRGQFTGLQQLIDEVPVVRGAAVEAVSTLPSQDPATAFVRLVDGEMLFTFGIPQGVGGQDVTGATMDSVSTLEPAYGSAFYANGVVHFSLGIPRGNDGGPGQQGPPGEVTTAQMDSAISAAIADTARNPNGVSPLNITISDPPTQSEVVQILDKMNELIAALFRTP